MFKTIILHFFYDCSFYNNEYFPETLFFNGWKILETFEAAITDCEFDEIDNSYTFATTEKFIPLVAINKQIMFYLQCTGPKIGKIQFFGNS